MSTYFLYFLLYFIADMAMGGPIRFGLKKLNERPAQLSKKQLQEKKVEATKKRLDLLEQAVVKDDREALAQLDRERELEES